MTPTREKAMSREAGPPFDKAFPDPTNNPVPSHAKNQHFHSSQTLKSLLAMASIPIEPPIAIICKCLPFSFLDRPVSAVAWFAASTSKTFPSAPTTPLPVMRREGSRRKPSIVLSKKFPVDTASSFEFQDDSSRGEVALREELRETVRAFSMVWVGLRGGEEEESW